MYTNISAAAGLMNVFYHCCDRFIPGFIVPIVIKDFIC